MTDLEIVQFIEKFEAGTLKESEWRHREHLLMALWYFIHHDELTALVRIKAGILRYNLIYRIPQDNDRGYHETITMFFAKLVQSHMMSVSFPESWSDRAAFLAEKYPDFKATLKQHYQLETIRSRVARMQWVAPDLKPIDVTP